MLLNRIESLPMNNFIRAACRRRFEAKRLLSMGGSVDGGVALEIGCGRGVGIEIILETFGARRVHAFDLDRRMVSMARQMTRHRGSTVSVWLGDATCIPARDGIDGGTFGRVERRLRLVLRHAQRRSEAMVAPSYSRLQQRKPEISEIYPAIREISRPLTHSSARTALQGVSLPRYGMCAQLRRSNCRPEQDPSDD